MNIVFNHNDFNIKHVLFLDTKNNIIMDGNFTKIIYSDSMVSLNGVYMNLPLTIDSVDKITNKYMLKFSMQNSKNINIINALIKIEYQLIEYYKKYYNIDKLPSYILRQQLNNGSIKLYKENDKSTSSKTPSITFEGNRRRELERNGSGLGSGSGPGSGSLTDYRPPYTPYYILKISGIWETFTSIGITYKIIECKSI